MRFTNLPGKLSLCLLSVLSLLTSGCSLQPVAAWEKGPLADRAMQFGGDPVVEGFDDHFYFSQEAASGGRGFSGGGCGCN